MDFLRAHQLDIMLFLSGVCGILAVMTMLAKSLPRRTKFILTSMDLSAMMLLIFDRYAYIFRGDASALGFYMVRICNGMVFFLSLLIPFLVTRYLVDLYLNEGNFSRTPVPFRICDVLFGIGVVLLVVSQFTGLYYTFDAQNNYHRSPLHVICYAVPFLIVLLQEWMLIRYRKRFKSRMIWSIVVWIALPTLSSVLQIFFYGISLINMTTVLIVIVFYTYALNYLNEVAERARMRELESYKEAQRKEFAMFEQTTEALANAIDAKDRYTSGHSLRVALYSRQIAQRAGCPPETCEQVYFAALLHDVGKIGINDDIINKIGKLTDEEFRQIKIHPILGDQILSSIEQAPFLRVGAHYHHERFDGRGYPDGLTGDQIPEIARIIAVADAYDAMTSNRSYREPLDRDAVRAELETGAGTQFDPGYAEIMLQIMEEGGTETTEPTD